MNKADEIPKRKRRQPVRELGALNRVRATPSGRIPSAFQWCQAVDCAFGLNDIL